jgi:hypothetical protein
MSYHHCTDPAVGPMEWTMMLKLWGKETGKKNIARNRQIWQKLLRKAMAQKGLFCQW